MAGRRSFALLAAGAALLGVTAVGVDAALDRQAAGGTGDRVVVAGEGLGGVEGSIETAQERLVDLPGDWQTWAQLGVSYIEQARITGDATFYQRSESALERSLEIRPDDNALALSGQGALANARHDFAAAADRAEEAIDANPASSIAWGVLADARVQLGEYDAATEAVQQMLDLRPTLPALTRASYDRQVHGEFDDATRLMQLALDDADSRSGRAWTRTHLSELAFLQGDLGTAREHAEAGLRATPGDPRLQAALARVEAAEGNADEAVALWDQVVIARPLPEHLAEYGTYLEALGQDDAAEEQFDVYETVQQLFEDNGVADDLTGAYLAADFGDPQQAVERAERERELRENIDSADAMAWALHAAGRDEQALPFAREATALGSNATFLYHRGMIEAALGQQEAAVASLEAALAQNPHFSPLHAPRAEARLAELRAG